MNAKARTIAKPKPIQEDDFLTLPEIAFLARNPRTGEPLKRASVEQWRIRNVGTDKEFLEPDGHMGSIPYWRLGRVLAWMDLQDRPHNVDEWRAKRESGGFRRHQDLI